MFMILSYLMNQGETVLIMNCLIPWNFIVFFSQ